MLLVQLRWFLFLGLSFLFVPVFAHHVVLVNQGRCSQHHGVTEITFDGFGTPDRVSKFIDYNKYSTAKTLVLASLGGNVESAIKLGNWIFDKSLTSKLWFVFPRVRTIFSLLGERNTSPITACFFGTEECIKRV
jgi:hypothetical protein